MSKINNEKTIKEFAIILLELTLNPNCPEYQSTMQLIDNMSSKDASNYIEIAKNNIEKYKKLYDLAQEIIIKERDQQIKELTNEFVNTSYDYFVTIHCGRHIFPWVYSTELDQRIQSLIELYERKLPYLMRNPDVVFQTLDHLETDNIVQNEIIKGINTALKLEDESEEDVNDFIGKLLDSWSIFKQQQKESK